MKQLSMFALAIAIAAAACGPASTSATIASATAPAQTPSAVAPTVLPPTPAATSAAGCHIRGALPDPTCTPGATDPRVTQANIGATICVSGYTTTVRPPVSYTDPLKLAQMQAYGFAGSTADFEEDHLIALELGGDPRDPRNLWPEPRGGQPNAGEKDTLENHLHAQVCSGAITLVVAQECIRVDWVACAGLSTAPAPPQATAVPAPTPPPAPPTPAPPPQAPTAPPTVVTPAPPPSTLTVTITASDWGSLAAVTSAGSSCTATARYANGNLSAAAGITATKIADGAGNVSWTYTRTATTTKGTGTHTVTCSLGGQTATASATFIVQ